MFAQEFREILATIYDGLPRTLREPISPIVESTYFFLKRVLLVISQIRLSGYLLKGKEKWGNGSLTALLFAEKRSVAYFSGLLYAETPAKEWIGKVFVWKLKSILRLDTYKADLIFVEMDAFFSRFLARMGFLILPQWVLFVLDISKPLPEIWKSAKNKSLQNNLRKIKKDQYSFEMSGDPAKFEYFYHHMYFPYAVKRFGEATIPSSYHYLKRAFERGQFLLVKRDDNHLAGTIIYLHKERPWVHSVGIKEGSIEYLRQGVLAASYYFAIVWAKEKGYELIDFGHCRPFLNDGVFRFKKTWGMGIERSKRNRAIFGMKVSNLNHGVRSFLSKNPFIFINRDRLRGYFLSDQDHPLMDQEIQSLFKTLYISGLDCLIINCSRGLTQQARDIAKTRFTQRVYLENMPPEEFFGKIDTF